MGVNVKQDSGVAGLVVLGAMLDICGPAWLPYLVSLPAGMAMQDGHAWLPAALD